MAVVRRDRLHPTPADGAGACSESAYAHTASDVDTVVVKSRLAAAEGCLPAGDESAIRAEAETQQSAPITRTRISP